LSIVANKLPQMFRRKFTKDVGYKSLYLVQEMGSFLSCDSDVTVCWSKFDCTVKAF